MIKEAIDHIAKRFSTPAIQEKGSKIYKREDYSFVSDGKTRIQPIHTTCLDSFVGLVDKFSKTKEFESHKHRFTIVTHIDKDCSPVPSLSVKLQFLPSTKEIYQREQENAFLTAKPFLHQFPFEKYLPQEEFIINFLSAFELNDSSKRILKVVQKATATQTHSEEDDGVSQTTMMKQGIEETCVKVENPVTLPLRASFAELSAIEAPFIFRKKIENGVVKFALISIPNTSAWLEAANEIRSYLVDAQVSEELNTELLIV